MIRLLAYLLLAVAAVACDHKPLCFDHDSHAPASSVEIDASWELVWNIDGDSSWPYGDYRFDDPALPDGLRAMMYNGDDFPETFNLPPGGGRVNSSADYADLLFYNNDTEAVLFEGMEYIDTAKAMCRRASRGYALPAAGARVTVGQPDVVFRAVVLGFGGWGASPLRVEMRPVVFSYHICVTISRGRDYAALARGTLYGMALGAALADGCALNEVCGVFFDADMTPYGAAAEVKCFGAPTDISPASCEVALEVKLRNGKIKLFNIDVTDQIVRQPCGGVIIIDGLEITDEEGEGAGAGFEVDVEDWGDDVDIPIFI